MLSDTSHDIVAIRCRKNFTHQRQAYLWERGWVREVLDASPEIFFVECMGSYPLFILRGFNSNRVDNKGMGIGADNRPTTSGGKRQRTISRIAVIDLPKKKSIVLNDADLVDTEDGTTRTMHEVQGPTKDMEALAAKFVVGNNKKSRTESTAGSFLNKLWSRSSTQDNELSSHYQAKKSYVGRDPKCRRQHHGKRVRRNQEHE